jgi:hypothetical protein
MLALLIFATIGDLLLAVLLVAVSGSIFGGQEGMAGAASAVAMWSLGIGACLGAPIGGFILRTHGREGLGALAAVVPMIGGLVVAFWPFNPY